MAVLVCHSPKGGSGATFLAAHIAIALGETGRDVTAMSFSRFDTLALHFGLPPATVLPALTAPADEAVVANGVDLRHSAHAPRDPDFVDMLRELGWFDPAGDRLMVLDVPANEADFALRLIAEATLHVCPLNALPDSLALLPQVLPETHEFGRSLFVLTSLDETRRLSRHSAAFLRELLGDRIIGRIRADECIPEAIAMLQPLARYAPASAALVDARKVAALIAGQLDAAQSETIAARDAAVDAGHDSMSAGWERDVA